MRLDEAKARLAALIEDNADAEGRKDVSENSARDAVIAEIQKLQNIIAKMERDENLVSVPGTWGIGDTLNVTYKKIVSYGKEVSCPPGPIKIQLQKTVDVTTLNLEDELTPVAINSRLGEALFNKAHKSARFETSSGYCEVEVERVLV